MSKQTRSKKDDRKYPSYRGLKDHLDNPFATAPSLREGNDGSISSKGNISICESNGYSLNRDYKKDEKMAYIKYIEGRNDIHQLSLRDRDYTRKELRDITNKINNQTATLDLNDYSHGLSDNNKENIPIYKTFDKINKPSKYYARENSPTGSIMESKSKRKKKRKSKSKRRKKLGVDKPSKQYNYVNDHRD